MVSRHAPALGVLAGGAGERTALLLMARARDDATSTALALPWIVGLRWHAVVGQALAVGVVGASLGGDLPFAPLLASVALLAMSNVVLAVRAKRAVDFGPRLLGAVLLFDAVQLTAQLALSGGAENPFAVLYLVEVLIAVLALPSRWIVAVAATSVAGFSLLFLVHRPLTGVSNMAEALGRWTAIVLAVSVAAYLGGRMAATLRHQASALARSQRIAGRAEKLAALSALAAGAAHELGTPLGTIAIASSELEALIEHAPEEAIEEARVLRDEVDRCRAILDRMSGRAGAAIGEAPETINAAAVLAIVRHALAPRDRARLRVEGALEATVRCPVESLAQVLTALVTNALQASGADDAVLARVDVPEPAAARSGRAVESRVVRFVVSDRGAGMPAHVLARAGEPFFTTKPPGKGMGLGLFLAQSFADLCSGSLEIESIERQGTRVCLTLPRLAGEGSTP